MDFISWPELFLSLCAVVAVFLGVIGLMVTIVTELTEDGPWFLYGGVLPGLLFLVGLFLSGTAKAVVLGVGALILIAIPWTLVLRRREECLRSIGIGQALFFFGALSVAGLLHLHSQHFLG
ncbi:MAG: hypothetical protein AAF191_12625 [Verrucomicrobiota bacterium]